jgi:ABC-type Mn2+/Zn2+ transport system permease subunit
MIILILIDIAIILGVIVWLAYKYIYQSTVDQNEKQTNGGTVWTIEKDLITHF